MMTLFDNTKVEDPRVDAFLRRVPDLIGEGWYELMKEYIQAGLGGVISMLIDEANRGIKVYPGSSNMFNCFKECPLDSTKVVFVGQDPYYQPGVADGLAFSCSITGKEQPSLKFIYDEIQRTAYHYQYSRRPGLQHWANQGILLMNTALTVQAYKPDSHTSLWTDFITYLLTQLNKREDIVYVFVGNRAKQYQGLISEEKNKKFTVVHPAAAAHRGGTWDCNDIFNKINQALVDLGKTKVVW